MTSSPSPGVIPYPEERINATEFGPPLVSPDNQRLTGVELRTPSRVVTPSPLQITLIPVWAGGPDELNPLYVSPASGRPSQMLTAVTGGEE